MPSEFEPMTTAEAIYLLCAAASLAAALLLLRQYRRTKTTLLFWSCIGFVGLAANNVLLYVDLVLVPSIDLGPVRTAAAAAGILTLLYGLLSGTRA
jgi:hypothetical protein